jgi:hypothetical protein
MEKQFLPIVRLDESEPPVLDQFLDSAMHGDLEAYKETAFLAARQKMERLAKNLLLRLLDSISVRAVCQKHGWIDAGAVFCSAAR